MVLRRELFRKVTIIGVGLIGGSLGMALKKLNLVREVVGLSQRHSTLVYAIKNQVIDQGFTDFKQALNNADLVILATPVSTILKLIPQIAPFLKRNCIVTDVGSTKVSIVAAAEKHLPTFPFFIGGHPLAGSEKRGATYAHLQLFENAICILTPTEKTNQLAREKVRHLWIQLGAQVKFLSPDEHDRILAFMSHMPHLLAYALMEVVPPSYLEFASQGIKDMTRIAASSAEMWSEICTDNDNHTVHALDQLVAGLSAFRKAIVSKNAQSLLESFQKAKTKRDSLENR